MKQLPFLVASLATLPSTLLMTPLMASESSANNKIQATKETKPNIVFFLTEDTSTQFLAAFNQGKGAEMPHMEGLAKEGVLFDRCYSSAPVSSAARTTLITGCYAPRFAGDFHRRLVPQEMPTGLHLFPYYLGQEGYFTVNAKKTDYNIKYDSNEWDIIKGRMGDWRKRKSGQPFFFQRSYMETHESRLQFSEEFYRTHKTIHDPAKVNLQPFIQDSPLSRYTYAHFYDRIRMADDELGKLVSMLKEDGVLDNTFIFFFGDNGGTTPGTKGYTNDIGFHVPLMVYVPKLWRAKLDIPYGEHTKALVDFSDLTATALNLAGVAIPKQMDGQPFLGPNSTLGKEAVHCYGDRFDELYSFNRVMYKGNYRYARNYQPYHTQSLWAFYRYRQLAFLEWKSMYQDGKLDTKQSAFFQAMPTEELYDLITDPNELHNLATDVSYRSELNQMRNESNTYLIKQADLGFYPETVLLKEAQENPDNWGNAHRKQIESYLEMADQDLCGWDQAKEKVTAGLQSADPVLRWWALDVCAYYGKQTKSLREQIKTSLAASNPAYVRARALVALAEQGVRPAGNQFKEMLKQCQNGAETLLILNEITHLIENKLMDPFVMNSKDCAKTVTGMNERIAYINNYSLIVD
ncbi:MAG: sulfatase [Bacteroidaceae bacterium]